MATGNTGGGTPPPPPANTIPSMTGPTGTAIKWVVTIVFIFVFLLLLKSGCNKSEEETAGTQGEVKENSLEPTLYSLPADGSAIYVWIENPKMYKTYPKGGPVKITTTSGRIYIDRPGVDIKFADEVPGNFKFQIPDSSSATGIEILQ